MAAISQTIFLKAFTWMKSSNSSQSLCDEFHYITAQNLKSAPLHDFLHALFRILRADDE